MILREQETSRRHLARSFVVPTWPSSRSATLVGLLFGTDSQSRLQTRAFNKGEFPMREGDPSDYVFHVRVGGLIILSEREDGSHIASEWIGSGGLAGFEDAVSEGPYRHSCRATAASVMECLPARELRHAVRTNIAIALEVASYLSDRVHFFAHRAETLALEGLHERVKRTLRMLAEREIANGETVSVNLTQGDLAALAGASRQRVNPILTELQRGIIKICSTETLHL